MLKIKYAPGIKPLPLEKRPGRVPRRGFASLRPARRWQDALISGNGVVETKTYGNPHNEVVLFTHEEILEPQLPEGVAYPQTAPQISGVLSDVRRATLDGDFAAATDLAFDAMKASGYTAGIMNNVRRDAFVLHIDTEADETVHDYLRSLDFRTGETVVSWTDSYGAWERKSFVSRPAGVVVQQVNVPAGYTGTISLRIRQNRPGEETDSLSSRGRRPTTIQLETEYSGTGIRVAGRCQCPPGAGYAGCVRIETDGSIDAGGESAAITRAGKITLYTSIEWALDYSDQTFTQAASAVAVTGTYEELLAAHAELHTRYFDRVQLDLAEKDDLLLTTEELLTKEHLSEGLNLALVEKVFDMGRYFLLFSHGRTPYVWGHVNINVNLQVSSGVQTAAPEMMESYFSWIEGLLHDWRENAKSIFGFRGLLASAHPDALTGVLFHTNPGWAHHYWIAGAGWCYQPFWEYYQATGDLEFARNRIFPGLKECADFFDDYLTLKDDVGNYIFSPSYSPENWPDNLGSAKTIVINSVMDISVCREVMLHLLELCETLSVEDPSIPRWKEILAHLPPYLLDDLGALKEWAWEDLDERYDHRHLSHLYGVWPGDEIRHDIDPDLADAALMANRKRAQGNASIHGIMHRVLAAARLGDPFLVGRNLKQVLDQGYLNPGSMMTNHNPYRLYCPDACGSLPVLLIETVVYSRPGVIDLLPAVPDSLPKGTLKGCWSRTRAVIEELSWDLDAGSCTIAIRSFVDQELEIRPPAGAAEGDIKVIKVAKDQRWRGEYSF